MTIEYKPVVGVSIGDACRQACALADDNHVKVSLLFNSVTMLVLPGDKAVDVRNRYNEVWRGKREG